MHLITSLLGQLQPEKSKPGDTHPKHEGLSESLSEFYDNRGSNDNDDGGDDGDENSSVLDLKESKYPNIRVGFRSPIP